MQDEAWLNDDDQFRPGQELFRSDRRFTVWAYTVSHSQLLLRARTGDGLRRIDVLFKPVECMKIRTDYDTLVVRSATVEEHVEILTVAGKATPGRRVLILETADRPDYVVTGAFGWKQDDGDDRDPSVLAGFAPGTDPTRILP